MDDRLIQNEAYTEHPFYCYICESYKDRDSFYKDVSRKNNVSTKCKICHKSKMKSKQSSFIATSKFCPSCELQKPSSDFCKQSNGFDGLQSHCKQCRNEYEKINKRNPDKKKIVEQKRRALKLASHVDNHTLKDLEIHFNSLGNVCFYCGHGWEHVEHKTPLSRGGSHTLDNIVPSCAKCNWAKGTKTDREFIMLGGRTDF